MGRSRYRLQSRFRVADRCSKRGWTVRVGEAEVGDGDETRVQHGFPSDGDVV